METLKQNPNKSVVISTLSLQHFLCQLSTVADDKTKKSILKDLGIPDDGSINNCYLRTKEMLNTLQESDLIFINNMYLNKAYQIKNTFPKSKENFGINIEQINFKNSVTKINRDIASGTYSRVSKVLDKTDIRNDTGIIFITAAHFKPNWGTQFNIRYTKYRKFYHDNGKVSQVQMMTRIDEFFHHEDQRYKYLIMKLGARGCTLTIVIPTMLKSIQSLLEDLARDPDMLNSARRDMKWKELQLVLPRFRIKNNLDLYKALDGTGVRELFTSKFSGIKNIYNRNASHSNLAINVVKQSIFLDVDEFGVSRVFDDITTADPPGPIGADPYQYPEFVVDRPFFFTFNLEESAAAGRGAEVLHHELFSGIYYGPE